MGLGFLLVDVSQLHGDSFTVRYDPGCCYRGWSSTESYYTSRCKVKMTMPTTFFTAERLAEFWVYVKWFMSFNMPIFMIVMAALVAGLVLDMIIGTVETARDEHDKKDDDIDVKYY
jgi:hypothetical protein